MQGYQNSKKKLFLLEYLVPNIIGSLFLTMMYIYILNSGKIRAGKSK